MRLRNFKWFHEVFCVDFHSGYNIFNFTVGFAKTRCFMYITLRLLTVSSLRFASSRASYALFVSQVMHLELDFCTDLIDTFQLSCQQEQKKTKKTPCSFQKEHGKHSIFNFTPNGLTSTKIWKKNQQNFYKSFFTSICS